MGRQGGQRGETTMAGSCQLVLVVGLCLLMQLPLSILDDESSGESTESTPPLPPVEEDDAKEEGVDIPYTSSLGLFEENILWKGFINTKPIDESTLAVPAMEKKLDSESNDKESGEYRGVVVTHPYPNP